MLSFRRELFSKSFEAFNCFSNSLLEARSCLLVAVSASNCAWSLSLELVSSLSLEVLSMLASLNEANCSLTVAN